MDDPRYDVRLFRRDTDTGREVLAYAFHGTSTANGQRWRLGFLYAVGRVGGVKQEAKGHEEQEKKGGVA
jgi:hypothetical protein